MGVQIDMQPVSIEDAPAAAGVDRMKRILIIYVLALLPVALLGQSTTTTATITDTPDGSVWAGGVYQIQFVPGSPPTCTWSGGTLTLQFNGTLGSSGAFSVSLPSNSSISCPGNQWAFTMCPNATTGCFTVNTTVTGASQSLTTLLSTAAASPRFPASPQAYGYTTAEVNSTPKPGWQFFNTTPSASPQCSQWTGSAWQSCGGLGSSTVVQINGIPISPPSPANFINSASVLPSANGNQIQFSLAGGSSVTWPTSGDLVLSNGTNSPAGLAPINGDCPVGSGGVWAVGSCGGSGPFPQTVSGTTTSGGIPFFSSATSLASSGLLAAKQVLLGGGAGTAPSSDSNLDDGATTANTLTYKGTGGIAIPNGPVSAGSGSVLYSALPTCNTTIGPALYTISDPAVFTWGSAASGTGTATGQYEAVFCDGVSWKVMGYQKLPAPVTVTAGTSAIGANLCNTTIGTPTTVTMTGATTAMTAKVTPTSDLTGVTGWSPSSTGQLYWYAWISAANTLSYYYCNPTASSITPSASTTWNVSAGLQ